jgi:aryl-alcohol dehydrogenase-like predicted oxidoreductase
MNRETVSEKRPFGNTDMQITPIGFGAWALGGGDWVYSWGPQDDQESKAAIYHALDLGINWIDTAAGYGLGHAEEVIGQALEGMSERPYLFTKCSLPWNERGEIVASMKRDSIRRECEDSLRRLKVSTIDLYQIHWPNPDPDIEEGWAALAELQREGKVRWIGVSNFSVAQMKRAEKIAPISSLQPPYSLIRPEVQEEILPYCQQKNIGVIVYSPMYSGLLSGKMTADRIQNMPPDDWRQRDAEFQMPKLKRNLRLVSLLAQIGQRHNVEPGVVAIAWTLRLPSVTGAIVGARRPSQVDGVLPAATFRLSSSELEEIDGFISSNH